MAKSKSPRNYINGLEFTAAYRQGEILIFKLKDPKDRLRLTNFRRVEHVRTGVIRTGEKEGHQHKIIGQGDLFMAPESLAPTPGEAQEQPSQGIIEVGKEGAQVVHPEHGPLKLPEGKFVVQTQKEATGRNQSQSVKD